MKTDFYLWFEVFAHVPTLSMVPNPEIAEYLQNYKIDLRMTHCKEICSSSNLTTNSLPSLDSLGMKHLDTVLFFCPKDDICEELKKYGPVSGDFLSSTSLFFLHNKHSSLTALLQQEMNHSVEQGTTGIWSPEPCSVATSIVRAFYQNHLSTLPQWSTNQDLIHVYVM